VPSYVVGISEKCAGVSCAGGRAGVIVFVLSYVRYSLWDALRCVMVYGCADVLDCTCASMLGFS
jgi:hypothetical protein